MILGHSKSLCENMILRFSFLYRPNADKLYQCINTDTSQLPKQQMIQLPVDGPNTNWKVFEKFNTAREANDDPCFAGIGSCSLHMVSGSLNAGVTETSWEIDKIMKSMWKLLSDSLARRDEYLKLSVSGKFPLKFCATHWMENEDTTKSYVSMARYHSLNKSLS